MNCPRCHAPHCYVIKAWFEDDHVRREWFCPMCGFHFYGVERLEGEDHVRGFRSDVLVIMNRDSQRRARELAEACRG